MKNIFTSLIAFLCFINIIYSQTKQETFERKRAQFKSEYLSARNEIKKSAVFNDANSWSKSFFLTSFNSSEYWYGRIVSISTNQGGSKVAVQIKSNSNGISVFYGTDSEMFTTYEDLIIKKGSNVYQQLLDIAEGDYVKFKFVFVTDADRGILEKSITEEGSVTEPEFIVKFISIELSKAPQQKTESSSSQYLPSGPVTLAQYNRVETGMSYDQVIKILGKPSQEMSRSEFMGTVSAMYMWEGSGFAANMQILFTDWKVVSKAQFGLK